MQREQAHPARSMNGVLVRMVSRFRDFGWYVMDCDKAVEKHHDHEDQQAQREIVQERVADRLAPTPQSLASAAPATLHRSQMDCQGVRLNHRDN